MAQQTYTIAGNSVHYHVGQFNRLDSLVDKNNTILITDEHVYHHHADLFTSWKHIIIPAGEPHKQWTTVQHIIDQLITFEADRSTLLIGVGGGVVTDITGFVASIYMRGLACAYVPTTILNLVDASLGGKTGIDYGVYKNMLGIIQQPRFILQDIHFLNTLPQIEWENGWAEIIKHAAIRDAELMHELLQHDLDYYQNHPEALDTLISRNIQIKMSIVEKDVWEKGDRKLLNFGHTIGHAIENVYDIKHGQAISIGMVLAAQLSESIIGFHQTSTIIQVLKKYQLPTHLDIDIDKVFHVLKMDKKRSGDHINFILLNAIGDATIQALSLDNIYQTLKNLLTE